jgi:hypothetical protein
MRPLNVLRWNGLFGRSGLSGFFVPGEIGSPFHPIHFRYGTGGINLSGLFGFSGLSGLFGFSGLSGLFGFLGFFGLLSQASLFSLLGC